LLLVLLALSVTFIALLSTQAGASSNVVALTGGGRHTCALFADGAIQCWGLNEDGQLGDGTNDSSSLPVDAVELGGGVSDLSAGLTHTCAVTDAGVAKCWGENGGRLGDGSEEASAVPVDVCADATCSSALGAVASIAAGGSHTCAVLEDGTVVCWGNNEDGQLGDGSINDSLTPVPVTGISDIAEVSLGTSSSCALTTAGALFCWGSNVEGQIGDDRACGMRCPLPQPVSGSASGVAQVSVGGLHACALTDGGAVLCWGFNFDGQVGDGTEDNIRIVPTQVTGLESGYSEISAGGSFRGHACAIDLANSMVCWGDNAVGQIGDGTTDDRSSPVSVGSWAESANVSVSAGDAHTCSLILEELQPASCWGSNSSGQLGDGTEVERHLPVTALLFGKAGGDANCDGILSSVDAALILQFTAGLLDDLPCNGDANADGRVDAIDAALVLQFTAGLLETF
jgi:alpha-tubulin suppressor-like RCC1 family protein